MKVYIVIYIYYWKDTTHCVDDRQIRGVFSSFDLAAKKAQNSRYEIEEHTLDGNEPAKIYYPTEIKALGKKEVHWLQK